MRVQTEICLPFEFFKAPSLPPPTPFLSLFNMPYIDMFEALLFLLAYLIAGYWLLCCTVLHISLLAR